MDSQLTAVSALIAFIVSISATYNAYMLRGGKIAISEILIALAMVAFMLSLILDKFLPDLRFIYNTRINDLLFLLGFIFLFLASFKLRSSLK